MLQIIIDDSGKADQSPVLVLAGYLASEERWSLLNDQWNTMLLENGMKSFHAAEVWRLAYASGLQSPFRRDGVFPTPRFRRDDGCPGLQAADMLAWLLRRDALNALRQVDRANSAEALMLGEAISMPSNIKIWIDDELRIAAERVAKSIMPSSL